MKNLCYIILLLISFCIGFAIRGKEIQIDETHTSDTVYSTAIVVETVKSFMPSPMFCMFLRDTTIQGVTLPIEQRQYTDSNYTVYVSGISPQLDSIHVYPKKVYHDRFVTNYKDRTIKVPDQKRWGIGVSVGYGFSRDGPSPYIGLGVNYSIFRF